MHIFPSSKHLIEAHLNMPLVHWLPKNYLRKILIFTYVLMNIEPKWEETKKLNALEKTSLYYNYSCQKTFYRSFKRIYKKLIKYNFEFYFLKLKIQLKIKFSFI